MTGCDFLKEMTADFRPGGIEGFSRTLDLKSELWRVFSEGLNQLNYQLMFEGFAKVCGYGSVEESEMFNAKRMQSTVQKRVGIFFGGVTGV